jgi:hypothetical protein
MKNYQGSPVPLTKRPWLCLAPISLWVVGVFAFAAAPPMPDYAILATIPGGPADGIWDYAAFDSAAHRLYLAQNGVTVLDAPTGHVSSILSQEPKPGSVVPIHAVVPLGTGDPAGGTTRMPSSTILQADI